MSIRKMICKHCGSENVRVDAWAVWDEKSQKWTLGETFDHEHCMDCEGETTIIEHNPETIV